MNEKAEELGCENTHFVTPNGLDSEDENGEHHTTAADLCRIMRYCTTISEKAAYFCRVTQTESYSFQDVDGENSYSCTNHNQLFSMTEGVISGKTGFTAKAGYCYVCAVEKGEKTFIIALLGCGWPNNKTYKWKDTLRLLSYGEEAYSYRKVSPLKLEVTLSLKQATYPWGESHIQQEATAMEGESPGKAVLMGEEESLRAVYSYEDTLTAPVKAGTQVGQVAYYLGDYCVQTDPLVIKEDIEAIDLSWCSAVLTQLLLMKNPDTSIDFEINPLYTVN
jgi:D-alanyl-D-alanine carboxypeptidase (penicillin-binding protein 5/6)